MLVIRIDHPSVRVIKEEAGHVYLEIDNAPFWSTPWLAYGSQEGDGTIKWIDGKYLSLSNRAVTLRRD